MIALLLLAAALTSAGSAQQSFGAPPSAQRASARQAADYPGSANATNPTDANPAAAPPMSGEPQAGGYAVNMAAVYVRRTPSLPGPVIDEEKAHILFKVISCQGGWCALDLRPKGGIGYLPANILQAVPPPR